MIARKLQRFFWTYCLAVVSTFVFATALIYSLRSYLIELANYLLGRSSACGCEQYVALPTNSSSWLLLASLTLIGGLVLLMVAKGIWAAWQTRQFRLNLWRQRTHTTYYRGVALHLVQQTEPLAVCVGYLRPVVYISSGLVSALDGFELLAVIQHEVAHAKRRDPLQRLALLALPSWLPGWGSQLEHYLAGQEIVADHQVQDTLAIQSAFVKLVDRLRLQPAVVATFFSTNQARVNSWLGERIPLPTLRIGLLIVTIWLLALGSSYRAFAAEPTTQAFGQCLAVQTMCESNMTYNLIYVVQ